MTSQQAGDNPIRSGDILVEKSMLLPEPFRLESDSTGSGFARVADHADAGRLEKSLATVGWTMFYTAGTLRASAFGFDRERMIGAATGRLLTTAKEQNCNCLEIDGIAAHRFCGMRYVSVSAHSRRIQLGTVFTGATT